MYNAPIQSKQDLEETAKKNGFKNPSVLDEQYSMFVDWMNRRDD